MNAESGLSAASVIAPPRSSFDAASLRPTSDGSAGLSPTGEPHDVGGQHDNDHLVGGQHDHLVGRRDSLLVGQPSYATSPVKRHRRTVAELDAVDQAIITAVSTENPVTVRGVYYRVVSAGAVEKTERGYDLVGRQLLKLRRDGRVPYSWITDGTRLILKPDSWTRLDEMLDDAAASYRRALWHDQDAEVIVLSEKDAISGVVYPVTAKYDVELGIARGYSSETFTHSIAETISYNARIGKTTFVYQLGDHDPSGVDAWRSFQERVRGFVPHADVVFERLAVYPAQIDWYSLPTRPTKTTDSRAKGFVGGSVEVDAIPPTELRSIVEAAIVQHIDQDQLQLTRIAEDSERDILHRMAGAS